LPFAKSGDDFAKVTERIGAITQFQPMRDLLRRLQRKAKMLGCQLFPIIDCLGSRNAMERVIDLGGRKAFCIKGQHFCRRQIFRIKISLPLRVLKTRCADPEFHANSSGQESLSKSAVQAPLKKPFDASSQQGAFESKMAASSWPAHI
jgi:hypothetical protein